MYLRDDHNIAAYSFDVFDTCLTRTYARPADLFYRVAHSVLATSWGERDFGPEEISELARLRVDAEARARDLTDREDITLADIYAAFGQLEAWRIDAAVMMDVEVASELEALRPVARVRDFIGRVRQRGARIAFLSDMYLPGSVIEHALEAHGFFERGDLLLVSGEVGVTKYSGGLFQRALELLGLNASRVHHLGDNVRSDFIGARRAGVKGTIFRETSLNRYERVMVEQTVAEPWMASRVAGASRVARLAREWPHPDDVTVAAIVAGCIAPLLTAFVEWTVTDAAQRGLDRLYFVARDGQLLKLIAERLGQALPVPELRYLYGSRQAWNSAAVQEIDRDDLEFLILNGQSTAPAHNLARVLVRPEEVSLALERHGFSVSDWERQLDPEGIDRFWRVVEEPDVSELILQRAIRGRSDALGYFRQEGLFDGKRWALVDVGWTMRTQRSLSRLLMAGSGTAPQAYYFGMSESRHSAVDYGRAHAFLLEEFGLSASATPVAFLFQNRGLIDQVFTMADHGTTRGYRFDDGRWCPHLAPADDNPRRVRLIDVIQSTTCAFVDAYVASGAADSNREEFKRLALITTGRMLSAPTRAEARALRRTQISDDPNEMRKIELARPLSPIDLALIGRDVINRLRRGRRQGTIGAPQIFYKELAWGFSWLEGSVALSGPHAKIALRAYRASQRMRRRSLELAGAVAHWLGHMRGS
jgi:HAD superfamily hydrolase (TIGR01549 family)